MVNINGLPEINGENYPLDIWSLYMQSAVQMFPEEEFDVPSPYLALEIKTDGRAYVKPEKTTEDTDKTTETTGSDTGSEDNPYREPAGAEPAQPVQPAPRFASPPRPAATPPAARPAPGAAGPRRGAPAGNDGPQRRGIR
jgi:penicillin-binding protein 1A